MFQSIIASHIYVMTKSLAGSGISLFGNASGTFNVAVDNILRASVKSTPTSLLYSLYDLTEGLHSGRSIPWKLQLSRPSTKRPTVTLNALPSTSNNSSIGFDFAVASSPINAK
jgi:hypothetical protein